MDNIPIGMLKDAAEYISGPLSHIINLSLRSGLVPNEWKHARVLPVYKSGSTSSMDNYRPISILPAVSKILERIVHDQFYSFIEENSTLFRSQFEFRRRHSTTLAVTYFTDSIMDVYE